MTNHPTLGVVDVFAATIPELVQARRPRQQSGNGPAD